jgi:membrane-associated protease RseP (regulator of RpoE activity)
MFDVYFWSVVAFFAILAAIIYKDRKKIKFHNYVLAMRRTKRGRKFIDSVANLSPRGWKLLATVGVVAAFGIMLYGIYAIILSAQLVIDQVITVPAIQFILPIPQSHPVSGSGFIGVPFWFWILIVPFVLFPHEFAHGLVSRASKVKIKSVGLIQLLIFSGAFVEPDEKQIKKSKLITKLRIFSAGSMANITIAVIVMVLAQFVLWPFFVPSGVVITEIVPESGAEAAGLKEGMVLQSIDDNEMNVDYNTFSASYAYLLFNGQSTEMLEEITSAVEVVSVLYKLEPGQTITVQADNNIYDLTLSGNPENASIPYMGLVASTPTKSEFMFTFMFPLIWWLTTLSLFIAIFNLLPIYPLDGGIMVEAISQKISKKHYKKIVKIVTLAVLGLLVFNFIGPGIIGLI